jgi:hypothetical protein
LKLPSSPNPSSGPPQSGLVISFFNKKHEFFYLIIHEGYLWFYAWIWVVFVIIIAVVFQGFFAWKCIKIIFFSFLKIYFWYQHIKTIQKHKKKKSFEEEINFFEKHSHGAKTNRTLKLTLFYGFMIYWWRCGLFFNLKSYFSKLILKKKSVRYLVDSSRGEKVLHPLRRQVIDLNIPGQQQVEQNPTPIWPLPSLFT